MCQSRRHAERRDFVFLLSVGIINDMAANQKLIDFIKQSLERGATTQYIITSLLNVGWTESQINEAFEEFGKTTRASVPANQQDQNTQALNQQSRNQQTSLIQQAQQAQQPNAVTPAQKTSHKKAIIISVFVVVLLLIGGSIYWGVSYYRNMTSEPTVYDHNNQSAPADQTEAVYYQNLTDNCKSAEENQSCCFASVDAMRAGNYKLAPEGGCPEGYNGNLLECVSSYKWCEPVTATTTSETASSSESNKNENEYFMNFQKTAATSSVVLKWQSKDGLYDGVNLILDKNTKFCGDLSVSVAATAVKNHQIKVSGLCSGTDYGFIPFVYPATGANAGGERIYYDELSIKTSTSKK